jgi:hypothetical protein
MMEEEEEVTSPVPHDCSDNSGRFDPAPPATIEGEIVDQTPGPTRHPEIQQEIQLPFEGTADVGEDSGDRYELRSRQAGTRKTTDDRQVEVDAEQSHTVAMGSEPPASSADEMATDQVKGKAAPRYNLRPLPGRKL